MSISVKDQNQLLITIIAKVIQIAKNNNLIADLEVLEQFKESPTIKLLAKLAAEKEPPKKAFNSTYKEAKKALKVLLSSIFQVKYDNLKKLFKPSEKEWKQIIANKYSIELYVRVELLSLLPEQYKRARPVPSHTRKRSSSFDKQKQNSDDAKAESSSPSTPKPASTRLNRMISFYNATSKSGASEPAKTTGTKTTDDIRQSSKSSSKPKVPLLALSSIPKLDLKTYFNDLFISDAEKATQFVISLVKIKEQFAWAIQILDAASNKNNLHITTTLYNQLKEPELLAVFTQLFQLEKQQTWCRSNQLFFTSKQHYLATEHVQEFRETTWNRIFSLAKPLAKIKLKQSDPMAFQPDSYSAAPKDIDELRTQFSDVLKQIFSPQNFPPLMKEIIKRAYIALLHRNDIANEEDIHIRTIIGFIALRFINPIIIEEATRRLTSTKLNTMEPATLQLWYKRILTSAIQSLTEPLNDHETTKGKQPHPAKMDKEPVAETANIEKRLNNEMLHEAIFSTVTQSKSFRASIYTMVKTALQLDEFIVEHPDHNDSKIPDLKEEEEINKLYDMLQPEKLSGLSFRADGSVTPGGKSGKQSVMNFFGNSASTAATPPNSSNNLGL